MRKLLILAAACALAAPLLAQSPAAVFTVSPTGQLVDQNGNALTKTSSGVYTDRNGAVFTVDGTGRLVDGAGTVVSAPGVVLDNGQSTQTALAPTLPGINNQTLTLGPAPTPSSGAAVGLAVVPAGAAGAPLATPAPAPPAAARSGARVVAPISASTRRGTGGGTIQTANGAKLTVGTSSSQVAKRDDVYTVRSYSGGKLVLARPDGTTRTLRVTRDSRVPRDLTEGRQVVVTTRGGPKGAVGTVTYYPVTVTPD